MPKRSKLAVIFGGPSLERGISLNSARSLCDHLSSKTIEIIPIYFATDLTPYLIPADWLYSNTPSDFDFKLGARTSLSRERLRRVLQSVDLVFPAIHGKFGEDGKLQALLEEWQVPFVASPSRALFDAFDKSRAQAALARRRYYTVPHITLRKNEGEFEARLKVFFRTHRLKRIIVKPAAGGSSIGVGSFSTVKDALHHCRHLFKNNDHIIVEKFCVGREFTAVILENGKGEPVCTLPIEVDTDYSGHQIFDYRRKYLPTRQVVYHCPPRFSENTILSIQKQAEQIFKLFHMRDFARFDGFVLPDGKIWFSDLNPISGMEQNSFLFIQAARLGMSHSDLLHYIVRHAAKRFSIELDLKNPEHTAKRRKPVNVIFGGDTAERQVSVMSGTNVWLKLRRSNLYEPRPYLLDSKGYVWRVPYALALNHTAEDILDSCKRSLKNVARDDRLRKAVLKRLELKPSDSSESNFKPKKVPLLTFLKNTKRLYIGLHGGFGENGELQALCQRFSIQYNGSDAEASRLCMDKYKTCKVVESLGLSGVSVAKKCYKPIKFFEGRVDYTAVWKELKRSIKSSEILVKPNDDGCSAGVAILRSPTDLKIYLQTLLDGEERLSSGSLSTKNEIIEMPAHAPQALLFEEFIKTDRLAVQDRKLIWRKVSGWVEVTVGVLGPKGKLKALNPSLTVTSGNLLTVEEKFQGGTGINITPPPKSLVTPRALKRAKANIEKVANGLGISGYARIDAFLQAKSGDLIIIEANTLPALTPSTVLYHQALAEKKPIPPRQLLELILGYGKTS